MGQPLNKAVFCHLKRLTSKTMSYTFTNPYLNTTPWQKPIDPGQDPNHTPSASELVFQAIKNQDIEKLQALLKSVDVLHLGNDADGNSALLAAIRSGNIESTQLIIGALSQEDFLQCIQQRDNKGEHPVYAATKSAGMLAAVLEKLDFLRPDLRADFIREVMQRNENLLFRCVHSLDLMTAFFNFIPEHQHESLVLEKSWLKQSLLHQALNIGPHEVASMLVKALPDSQLAATAASFDFHRNTTFFAAIKSGNIDVATKLIHSLPQQDLLRLIKEIDRDGNNPLYHSTQSPAIFLALLKRLEFLPPDERADVIEKSAQHGSNLLCGVAASIDMVEALFEFIPAHQQAALILVDSKHANNPLHHALRHQAYDVARLLIQAVAPSQRYALAMQIDQYSALTSFGTAMRDDVFDIAALLLNLSADPTADRSEWFNQTQFDDCMRSAVGIGTPQMVTKLLNFVPRLQWEDYINKSDEDGLSLLHFSSPTVRTTLLGFLPSEKRESVAQKIALDRAVDSGNIEKVSELLNSIASDEAMAFMQMLDSNGHTLLHRALRKKTIPTESLSFDNSFQMVKLLLQNGAKVDTNAVIFAMEFRSHAVFRLLLDPKTNELMHADKARRERLLRDKDTSLFSYFDSRGWNAMMYAIDREDEDAISHFEALGADRNSAMFLLNSYHMTLDEKIKKLQDIQRNVANPRSNNPIVKNMCIIYQLSLRDGLESAKKEQWPDARLIARLEKGLEIIEGLMPEEPG